MRNSMRQATSVACYPLVALVLLLFAGMCPAQTQFALAIGGADSDGGSSVAPTSDGGYIVTGWTTSFDTGSSDLFLCKFDSTGNLTWAKTMGGADSDVGISVVQTLDGGCIVTGSTRSFGVGYNDLFLVKFNSSGGLTWAKTVGGGRLDRGHSVTLIPDGGYIVTGVTNSFGAGGFDLFLVKFDSLGDLTWAKTVGGADWDEGKSVALTPDGGYIITGWTRGFGPGSDDLFLGKFNFYGDLTWAKIVGGADYDKGNSVALTSDSGYVVTGYTYSFGASFYNLFLAKFDYSGDLTWAKTVGGASDDYGHSVALTSDSEYVVTGYTYSFGTGGEDLFLSKFSSSGDLTWAKTVGGAGDDGGFSVALTSDGGYIVTGGWAKSAFFDNGDLFLAKFSSSGEIGDCPFVADCSPTVESCSLSSVSISPTVTTPSLASVSCSPTVTSLSPTVTVICTDISEALSKPISFELTVSPNPFNSSCAIMVNIEQSRLHRDCATVEIFDLQGKLIATPFTSTFGRGVSQKGGHENISYDEIVPHWGKMSEGQKGIYIWQPDETISSGVYIVRATTSDGQQITKRIVYLK